MSIILAIDTSCDDTSVAILQDDRVLVSLVSSQDEVHQVHGGVVPWLARGEHQRMLAPSVNTAMKRAKLTWKQIDAVAVTYGPGLAPALEIGIAYAKHLAKTHEKPLIAVNHVEGHTLSPFLKNRSGNFYSKITKLSWPALVLVVSGGHSEIVHMPAIGQYEVIGQTVDDAAGEAFDKVARMLDLGYPGGPVVAHLAKSGNATAYEIPRPMAKSPDYNFSFSGLKTACLYQLNDLKDNLGDKFAKIIPDYAASAQEAIVDALLIKFNKAIKQYQPQMLLVAGGVSANKRLRVKARVLAKQHGLPVFFPGWKFCTDNAAMIGLAAYYKFQRNEFVDNIDALDRVPGLNFDSHQIASVVPPSQ